MKPMELKAPAQCCGTNTLLWDKKKHNYVCPCGKLRVNEYGLPLRRFTDPKPKRKRYD